MNNKNRRFKQICLMLALAFIAIGPRYIQSNDIDRTKELALNSSIADQLPVTKYCLPNDGCNEEVKNNVVTTPQKKKVIWKNPLLRKDIHQCNIEFDEESVQQVNQIIEQLSYEVVLNETTHKINNHLKLKIISPELPDDFNESLGEKIQVILNLYKQWFGLYCKRSTNPPS